MGNYIAQSDIVTRIGSEELIALADLDEDGVADVTTVDEAIDDAESHIDSYLGSKFTVPVSPVPNVLQKRAVSLAVYFLQLRRNSRTDDMKDEFNHITQWLKDVVAGKATLGVTTPKPTESPGAGGVRYGGPARVFGREEPL